MTRLVSRSMSEDPVAVMMQAENAHVTDKDRTRRQVAKRTSKAQESTKLEPKKSTRRITPPLLATKTSAQAYYVARPQQLEDHYREPAPMDLDPPGAIPDGQPQAPEIHAPTSTHTPMSIDANTTIPSIKGAEDVSDTESEDDSTFQRQPSYAHFENASPPGRTQIFERVISSLIPKKEGVRVRVSSLGS